MVSFGRAVSALGAKTKKKQANKISLAGSFENHVDAYHKNMRLHLKPSVPESFDQLTLIVWPAAVTNNFLDFFL